MILKYRDSRFYSATPDRCYRTIKVPMNVVHPDATFQRRAVLDNPNGLREIIMPIKEVDPAFKVWLKSLGLEITLTRLFVTVAGFQYNRHVDRHGFNDQSVALNFAFEDAGTVFSWHNLKKGCKIDVRLNDNKVPVWYFNADNCVDAFTEEIQHEVNQPFLVNTGYIHSLKVGHLNRYCYSYFLKRPGDSKALQWDDALVHFKDYII